MMAAAGIVLLAAFTAAAAGCGGSSDQKAASSAVSADSAVQKIKDNGVLRVGVKVDVPLFGYKNPQTGQIEGFEIDLPKLWQRKFSVMRIRYRWCLLRPKREVPFWITERWI